jgi:hypothetical protein
VPGRGPPRRAVGPQILVEFELHTTSCSGIETTRWRVISAP